MFGEAGTEGTPRRMLAAAAGTATAAERPTGSARGWVASTGDDAACATRCAAAKSTVGKHPAANPPNFLLQGGMVSRGA